MTNEQEAICKAILIVQLLVVLFYLTHPLRGLALEIRDLKTASEKELGTVLATLSRIISVMCLIAISSFCFGLYEPNYSNIEAAWWTIGSMGVLLVAMRFYLVLDNVAKRTWANIRKEVKP